MVYSQEVAKIDAGQTIEWVPTDKGHNVEMLAGPSGYELPKKTKMNKPVTMTFTVPGIYLYQCSPHAAMGMIGLIVVGGDTSNMDAIKSAKVSGGKSKKKRDKLLVVSKVFKSSGLICKLGHMFFLYFNYSFP